MAQKPPALVLQANESAETAFSWDELSQEEFDAALNATNFTESYDQSEDSDMNKSYRPSIGSGSESNELSDSGTDESRDSSESGDEEAEELSERLAALKLTRAAGDAGQPSGGGPKRGHRG